MSTSMNHSFNVGDETLISNSYKVMRVINVRNPSLAEALKAAATYLDTELKGQIPGELNIKVRPDDGEWLVIILI